MSVRLAMWSGPRNLSTAMMRAWENRPDTVVWDEPLYAHYLHATDLDHPGRDEILAAGSTDWRDVAARSIGAIPDGAKVFYQKHMTHHLLPDIDRDWLNILTHVFLIRDPREVLLSYTRSRETVTIEDLGFIQQTSLFEWLTSRQGHVPLVIDSGDFLKNPRPFLENLCDHVGIEFSETMLSWPAGSRESDGVWAPHWYASVERSTGFAPWHKREGTLTGPLAAIEEAARPHYEKLAALSWKPASDV
jgi:hypothetical protein